MADRVSPAQGTGEAGAAHAGIVAFVSHGLPVLRTVVRGLRETLPPGSELAVVANGLEDYDATYLLRQYLRGRIHGLQYEADGARDGHCGLDIAPRLVSGEYLARVDDTLQFKSGWLGRCIEALEADPSLGCLSLIPPTGYQRGRGRPRTVHVEPIAVDHLDMRCFVTRRALVEQHERQRMGDRPQCCDFQEYLRTAGLRLAFLPGLVSPLGVVELPKGHDACYHEAELPPHEGAAGALQRLRQAYLLGDDVLLTCLSCGGTELETLAARIRFCERHQVAIGFWYELRCPECGELHYKEDYQFRCPE
ncbi:MAG: glycosyltransferase family 2 protein [Actinobacteria bacterium]|nr:glycosyltransferase family 2 protein [Actinomycetota bacterium]